MYTPIDLSLTYAENKIELSFGDQKHGGWIRKKRHSE